MARDLRFEEDQNGDWHPENWARAREGLRELAHWLGFASIEAYLDTLPIERERIFDRATY